MGSLPVLYAAVADIPGDTFVGLMRGTPVLIKSSKTAQDNAIAKRLLIVSEQLTGVSWPL